MKGIAYTLLLLMVPHDRRLGSYNALGWRFSGASEDLIVSTYPTILPWDSGLFICSMTQA
jgi:hypothetical protein